MPSLNSSSLLLDSLSDKKYNRYSRIAESLFEVPLVIISKLDINRLWFQSENEYPKIVDTGKNMIFPTGRDLKDSILVIEDSHKDNRFSAHPFVVDGTHIRFYAGRLLVSYDGEVLGTVCIMDQKPRGFNDDKRLLLNDMAETIQEEISGDQKIYKDLLTTLINRRGFMEIANTTLSVCARSNIPALLLMFNIKDFKHINKQYGHSEGDELLRKMAYSLIDTFRGSDVVARIADDEFCVLLTDINESSVHNPLSRLKEHFESQNNESQLPESLGYRVGIVHFDAQRHNSIYKLMEEADEFMQKQKHKEKISVKPFVIHSKKNIK